MTDIEKLVLCKHCGALIGSKLYDNLFVVGQLIVKELYGVCMNCNTAFRYSLSDDKLDLLLKRMLNARQEQAQP
jgi:hypothetical protein